MKVCQCGLCIVRTLLFLAGVWTAVCVVYVLCLRSPSLSLHSAMKLAMSIVCHVCAHNLFVLVRSCGVGQEADAGQHAVMCCVVCDYSITSYQSPLSVVADEQR